jgi:UrcA family protein
MIGQGVAAIGAISLPEALATGFLPSINQLEFNMTTKNALLRTKPYLGVAALAASVLLTGLVHAGNTFSIKFTVDTNGLDLTHEAGVRDLYSRLKNAADAVCNNVYRVGLEPVANYADCYEKALAAAVKLVNKPLLTQVYLDAHTLKDAAAHDVKVASLAAAAQPRR